MWALWANGIREGRGEALNRNVSHALLFFFLFLFSFFVPLLQYFPPGIQETGSNIIPVI